MVNRRVMSFNYTLKDNEGKVLDQSNDGPLLFLEGAGQIIPALEEQIINMPIGAKKSVKLEAKDAYGIPDAKMTMDVPKAELAHIKVEMGSFLQLQLQDSVKVVRVTKITDSAVTLDGNHPLAGVDLEFDIEIADVRPATQDEMAHGHAHGPGGHHHH
jgi:FKBP-type peptidyl-prolyl cis-trans isomerase SlyD